MIQINNLTPLKGTYIPDSAPERSGPALNDRTVAGRNGPLFFEPVPNSRMDKFDFWGVSGMLNFLRILPEVDEYRPSLRSTKAYLGTAALRSILDNFGLNDFTISKGEELFGLVDGLDETLLESKNASTVDFDAIKKACTIFEAALEGEFRRLHVYSVDAIGLYDIDALLDAGRFAFEPHIAVRIPEWIRDEVDAAGKCLAFDLNTACGFHMLRATEGMVHLYVARLGFTQEEIKECKGSWYNYANRIRAKFKPEHSPIAESIELLRQLHRNGIMHPLDTLSASEAYGLFGSCRSLIERIVAEEIATELATLLSPPQQS
jgi:hypothetical protein